MATNRALGRGKIEGRIPALDGWRGIAIALVLIDHIQFAILHRYAFSWTQTGQHGVTIFFVLSGFLITSKLQNSSINLKEFYVRRLLRLIPVAVTFLAALLLFDRLTGFRFISWPEVQACLLFYRNFTSTTLKVDGAAHFWSLSLEEQFYLVWPAILLIGGARNSRWFAAIGAMGCATYRWFFWAHYARDPLNYQTQVRADALLVGCLLALLLGDPRARSAATRSVRMWVFPASVSLLVCIASYHSLVPLYESISIAMLIAATTLHPGTFLTRLLDFPPLGYLGTISYSLYVWQGPFMAFSGGWSGVIALGILMPLFTLGSYYLIERPCVQIGMRLTTGQSLAGTAAREDRADESLSRV